MRQAVGLISDRRGPTRQSCLLSRSGMRGSNTNLAKILVFLKFTMYCVYSKSEHIHICSDFEYAWTSMCTDNPIKLTFVVSEDHDRLRSRPLVYFHLHMKDVRSMLTYFTHSTSVYLFQLIHVISDINNWT